MDGFGIKENTGGVGADLYLWNDRINLCLHLLEGTYASWPQAIEARLVGFAADISSIPHIYFAPGVNGTVHVIVRRELT